MISLNNVVIAGNLTRDPDIRATPDGKAVANLTVAINERGRIPEGGGQPKEEVVFIGVVAWERNAEFAKQFLKKGSPVIIQGKLIQDVWEKEDHTKVTKTKVLAFRLQFAGVKLREDGS